jgi:hypothetical protein
MVLTPAGLDRYLSSMHTPGFRNGARDLRTSGCSFIQPQDA